jgi:nucleotide-binding universal stress UspA family protein
MLKVVSKLRYRLSVCRGENSSKENEDMINSILVLLDGSPLAESVMPHVEALVHTFEAEVTLLHVLERETAVSPTHIDPINWQMRKVEAQAYLYKAAQTWQASGHAVNTVLLEGTAVDRIVGYIQEFNPDLIVLSSHGHGGLKPWNISSVAQKIIYHAFKSFMLVRAYQPPGPPHYRRIMLPLDGSPRAECVLPVAQRLAQAHEAELLLVHAAIQPDIIQRQRLTPEETHLLQQLFERNKTEAARYLAQFDHLTTTGVATHLLTDSSAADALLNFAEAREVDMVLLCAHGASGGASVDNVRPYGSVVSSFIAYGSSSLFIVQDLPAQQIKLTQAALTASHAADSLISNRTSAYAQPENWLTR